LVNSSVGVLIWVLWLLYEHQLIFLGLKSNAAVGFRLVLAALNWEFLFNGLIWGSN
jgi:hypothetical protein